MKIQTDRILNSFCVQLVLNSYMQHFFSFILCVCLMLIAFKSSFAQSYDTLDLNPYRSNLHFSIDTLSSESIKEYQSMPFDLKTYYRNIDRDLYHSDYTDQPITATAKYTDPLDSTKNIYIFSTQQTIQNSVPKIGWIYDAHTREYYHARTPNSGSMVEITKRFNAHYHKLLIERFEAISSNGDSIFCTRNITPGVPYLQDLSLAGCWIQEIKAIAIDPHNRNKILIGFGAMTTTHIETSTSLKPNHIYITTDGGHSWKNISQGLPDAAVLSIQFDGSHTEMPLVTTAQGSYIWTTTDSMWQYLPMTK